MHELLHLIGLCPDNLGHIDLLDFIKYGVDPGIRLGIDTILKFFKLLK